MKSFGIVAATAAFFALTGAAGATTITFNSPGDYGALVGVGPQVVEDFESFGGLGEGEVGTDFMTSVGTFNTLGGTGTGGTVTGLAGNTGTQLALRDGNTFGRENTTLGGNWYIDSNDTFGMGWLIQTGSLFSRVVFNLTDGSDTGAWLSIIADGVRAEQRTAGQLPNGEVTTVVIDFGAAVSSAYVEIANFKASGSTVGRLNDGFGIDDVSVNISAVPVPATLPLLLAGLGGLYLIRRRRSVATA